MNNDDDEILFTCENCGKQFAPDPDAMLEAEWEHLTEEMLANMTAVELKDWGLTEDDRKAILSGEELCDCEECQGDLPPAGAVCLCPDCRDCTDCCGCGPADEKDLGGPALSHFFLSRTEFTVFCAIAMFCGGAATAVAFVTYLVLAK